MHKNSEKKRRVVITGMGVITSVGIGIDPFWKGLLSSASGVKKITHFDATSFPVKIAAEVSDFNPETSILNNKL
ncbi:MAG: beta-ketoacyl synthase N-terminal-like domain-containing protein, partial [Nitrospirota bacterium]|nr:beta-ketoacyl synthase N-terminal-like domain-containing protein [Nitrospirota bacterium]